MTSAAQVSRLLSLVPYLQARPDAPLAQTATDFGVSVDQLIADLKVLWFCGLPGGLPDDLIEIDMDALTELGRIRLSNADYLSRPMRFTPDEATSLIVALRATAELVAGEEAEAINSALAKLEQAAGTLATPKVVLAGGSLQLRETLAQAIENRVVLELDYHSAGAAASTPKIAPARLISRDGFGYLQAWSLTSGGWRNYRLDRIDAVRVAGDTAPDLGEPPEFGPGWLDDSPTAVPVTIRVAPAAAWIAEYNPVKAVRSTHSGVEIDLLVADPAWLRTLLLRLGSSLRQVDPPGAAAGAREAAREALAAYAAQ